MSASFTDWFVAPQSDAPAIPAAGPGADAWPYASIEGIVDSDLDSLARVVMGSDACYAPKRLFPPEDAVVHVARVPDRMAPIP